MSRTVDRAAASQAWCGASLGAASAGSSWPCPGGAGRSEGRREGSRRRLRHGHLRRLVAERGLTLTGVDRDPEMVAFAGDNVPEARIRGEITRLPLSNGGVDPASAVTLLLGPEERRLAAGELGGVTRPGGQAVVGGPHPLSLWALKRRLQEWAGSPRGKEARFTAAGELASFLAPASATPTAARHTVYRPPLDPPPVATRADALQGLGRGPRPPGAAFVAVPADVPAVQGPTDGSSGSPPLGDGSSPETTARL